MKKPLKPAATKRTTVKQSPPRTRGDYASLVGSIDELLQFARQATARMVNSLMTATYWEVGRRIVEFEQNGKKRAAYGEELLKNLAADLSGKLGRGFSRQNLQNMRLFFQRFPPTMDLPDTVWQNGVQEKPDAVWHVEGARWGLSPSFHFAGALHGPSASMVPLCSARLTLSIA